MQPLYLNPDLDTERLARAISDKPGINKLDAHASCFLPGHYLNSHVDDGEINERQVAYTIGFTRLRDRATRAQGALHGGRVVPR